MFEKGTSRGKKHVDYEFDEKPWEEAVLKYDREEGWE